MTRDIAETGADPDSDTWKMDSSYLFSLITKCPRAFKAIQEDPTCTVVVLLRKVCDELAREPGAIAILKENPGRERFQAVHDVFSEKRGKFTTADSNILTPLLHSFCMESVSGMGLLSNVRMLL